jgi:hypothetical protein
MHASSVLCKDPRTGLATNLGERFVKRKLLLAFLSIALLPGTSFANKLDGAEPAPPHVVLADANGTMIGEAQTNVSTDSARAYAAHSEDCPRGGRTTQVPKQATSSDASRFESYRAHHFP